MSEYRVYIVPLARVYWGRRTNRADRAVKLIRRFVQRHTKADKILIANEVNEEVWKRGREKPPRRIKILVKMEERTEGENKVKVAIVKLANPKLKPGIYKKEKEGKKG